MKNIAEEEATRPGAGYLPAGFRLSAQITPGRPGRDAHPEVAQGVRPVAAAPRSRRSRALPARRDGPRGVGEGLRPARDIRDPPPPPAAPRAASLPRPAQPRAYSADSGLRPGRGRGVPARCRGASSCVSAEAS